MGQNHIGNIPAGIMKTENPARSNDVDFFPGAEVRWGLGYMLNMQPGPNGRSAGTVSWRDLQHLLLARPGAARHRADHAADPALCRPARVAALRAVRERYLQCCEGGVMPSHRTLAFHAGVPTASGWRCGRPPRGTSFAQAIAGSTVGAPANRKAAVDAGNDMLAPHEVRIAHDALGDELRVLDEVGCRVDHARTMHFPSGSFTSSKTFHSCS